MSKQRPGAVRRAIRRLANPAMVSQWSFGITLVSWLLSVYPLVLRGEALFTWRAVAAWVVIVLAGQAAIFTVLLIAKRLWLSRSWARNHPSVALWTIILAVAVGLGVARTVAGGFFSERDWALVGAEYFLFGVVVVVIAGSASVVFSEHRATLTGLGATRASLEASISAGEKQLSSDREQVMDEAQAILDEALDRLEQSPQQAAAFFTQASDEVVRPFSHQLVKRAPDLLPVVKPAPSPRWREVFSDLAEKSLIAPKALGLTVVLLSSRLSVTAYEPSPANGDLPNQQGFAVRVDVDSLVQSVTELVIVFFATLGVAMVINRLSDRVFPLLSTSGRWLGQLVSAVIVAVASQAVIAGGFAVAGFANPLVITPTTLAIVIGLVTAVTILVGVIRGSDATQRDVEDQLHELNDQLQWELSRLGQELWNQRREVGLALHSSVRSALIASAMQLRAGTVGANDIEQVRKRLVAVRDELRTPADDQDPARALNQLRELWKGTCAITVDADQETMSRLADDPAAAHSAMQVIDEACANAITHGDAQSIRITLASGDNWVDLDVSNDGGHPVDPVTPGLGLSALDEVVMSWELAATPQGTSLRARLPLKPKRYSPSGHQAH